METGGSQRSYQPPLSPFICSISISKQSTHVSKRRVPAQWANLARNTKCPELMIPIYVASTTGPLAFSFVRVLLFSRFMAVCFS